MMRRLLAVTVLLGAAGAQAQAFPAADSALAVARNLFRQVRYDSCIVWLNRADSAAGGPLLEAAYLRGLCHGYQNRYDSALVQLERHDRIAGDPETATAMKAATYYYRDKVFERMARDAVAAEAAVDADAARSDSGLAVLNFLNTGGAPDLDPLCKGLADMLITDLAQVAALRVVERTRMQKLVRELVLDSLGVTEHGDRARVARMLGAAKVVTGMFRGNAESGVQVRTGIVDAATKQLTETGTVNGPLAQIFALEKKAAFAIIDRLGITLTDEERLKIQTVRTENLLAFMAYYRGMDAQDRGDYGAALAYYREALGHDPAYADAATMAQAMETALELSKKPAQPAVTAGNAGPPVTYEGSGPAASQEVVEETRTVAAPRKASAAGSLVGRMATLSNAGFMPELGVSGGREKAADELPDGGAGRQRADYADYRNSGLENRTAVPVRVLLPQQ